MSERLGYSNQEAEALMGEVESLRNPVAQALSDARKEREKERLENGATTPKEETRAAKKVKNKQVQRNDGRKEDSARRR